MKEVIYGDELKKIISDSINLICNTVSSTLGPTGNNVIIDSALSPFITNDGVTIAENIRSNDEKINTILEIIKEASFKTNELVGDGTTTTLVLLKSIYELGIESKINQILLKKELDLALDKAITEINKLKKKPSKKELELIASTSCNDIELGKFLTNLFLKVKNKYAIRLEESNIDKTYYELKKGYNIEIDLSDIYFKDKDSLNFKSYILLLNGYLDSLEQISDIINEAITRNKNLIIFTDDYSDIVKHEIMLLYLEHNKNIFIIKTPDYGSKKNNMLKDISLLTNSEIKNIGLENIKFDNIYEIDITLKKNEIILISDVDTKEYIKEMKNKIKNMNDYDKELLESRIAKLENGIITIYVGAQTKLERREKIMRIEDAINALDIAKKGIVLGEGVTFLSISAKLNSDTIGENIIKKALIEPFKKIMENIGLDYKEILCEIKKNNYEKCYNYKSLKYDLNVIDPAEVLIVELKNSVSIASMLLTTSYLVINEESSLKNDIL